MLPDPSSAQSGCTSGTPGQGTPYPAAGRIETEDTVGQRPNEPNLHGNLATVTRRPAGHAACVWWPTTIRRARLPGSATVIAVTVATLVVGISVTVTMSRSDRQHASVNATASTCPPTYGAWHRGPQRPGTDEKFVPDTPVSATICRYYGSVARFADYNSLKLTGSTELSGAALVNFVTALNRAPIGSGRCPPPRNPLSRVLVRFHYTNGLDVEVVTGRSGCWNSSNGSRPANLSGIAIPG